MLVTYFRSSSLGTWKLCQQKFFINYVLGVPHSSNLAAAKGTVVHKIMELLALAKMAMQQQQEQFDAEELGMLPVSVAYDIEYLHSLAVPLVKKSCPNLTDPKTVKSKAQLWTKTHDEDCLEWTYDALNWQGGLYDPRNQKIVAVEKHFDFPIMERWAKYNFPLGGENIEGHLHLRGTVDLVIEESPGVLMVIDYKTSAPSKNGGVMDWATYKDKSHNDIFEDTQFRLYHYALRRMFPEYNHVFLTAFYIRAGGPRILDYHDDILPETEQRLRKFFEEMKRTQVPDVTPGKKCSFCDYSKISVDLGCSPCEFYQREVLNKGINQVIIEHGQDKTFSTYTGGGRTINKENDK